MMVLEKSMLTVEQLIDVVGESAGSLQEGKCGTGLMVDLFGRLERKW